MSRSLHLSRLGHQLTHTVNDYAVVYLMHKPEVFEWIVAEAKPSKTIFQKTKVDMILLHIPKNHQSFLF